MTRRRRGGMTKFTAGLDRTDRPGHLHLPRASPSSPTRSRAPTRSRRCSRTPTACVPTRSCGSPASMSARWPAWHPETSCKRPEALRRRCSHDDHRRQRAAASQGRDVRHPPAHLPRGQLLRRRASRHPEAPKAPGGFTFPIQNGVGARAARPGAHLAAGRHAPQSPDPARPVRRRRSNRVARPTTSRSSTGCRPTSTARSSPTTLLGLQPHDLSNFIDKGGTVVGGDRQQSEQPQGPGHRLQYDRPRVRRPAGQPAACGGRAARDPLGGDPGLQLAQRHHLRGPAVPACPPGRLPTLAKALIPGVKSTGPMVDASLPFIHQLRLLVQPSELQGLAKDLTVTIPALARLTVETIPFMRNQVRPASSCDGQRDLSVEPAHGPGLALQRVQRLPATARSTSRPSTTCPVWPASRATSTPTARTSASA